MVFVFFNIIFNVCMKGMKYILNVLSFYYCLWYDVEFVLIVFIDSYLVIKCKNVVFW